MRLCCANPERWFTLRLALWLALAIASSCAAQSTPLDNREITLLGAQRTVRLFDFEEPNNIDPVPMYWTRRIGTAEDLGTDFPRWNESGFDTDVVYEGNRSIKLPTRGGSTALRLPSGVIAALPGSDYHISAVVHTEGLTHASARLSARMLDAQGRPIPGAEAHSEPLRTAQDKWHAASAILLGDYPRAAWLQIDLELLQPDALDTSPHRGPLANLNPVPEDFRGAAWFDNVVVQQLPRLHFSTTAPAHVFYGTEDPPVLHIDVQDLAGEALQALVRVLDIDGRTVAERNASIPPGGADIRWSPDLPAYGAYRGELVLQNERTRLASAVVEFLWIPPPPRPSTGSRRHLLIADGIEPHVWPFLPEFAHAAGAGAVSVPLWDPNEANATTAQELDRIEPELLSLLQQNIELLFHIPAPTLSQADQILPTASATSDLLTVTPQSMLEALEPSLIRYGQRVPLWQIGPSSDPLRDLDQNQLSNASLLDGLLRQIAPLPRLALPWDTDIALPPELAATATVTLRLPLATQDNGIQELVEAWRTAGASSLIAVLEPLDHQQFSRRASVDSLIRRAALLHEAGADKVALTSPWRILPTKRPHAVPAPEAAAWRTFVEHLHDATALTRIPLGNGATGILFGPHDGASGGSRAGVIVAWSHAVSPATTEIPWALSLAPVRVTDAFGNTRLVEPDAPIVLTPSPVFISGVDTALALFRSSFSVIPRSIPSIAARHRVKIALTNPWPTTLNGRLRISEPSAWRISPRVHPFAIAPYEKVELSLDVIPPPAEESGAKIFRAEVELSSQPEYPTLLLHTPVLFGLDDLTLDITPIVDGDDLIVRLLVSNHGKRRLTLRARLHAPKQRSRQQPISTLEPGDTIVKQFLLRGAAATLSGKKLRVHLQNVNGPERLNKVVTAP